MNTKLVTILFFLVIKLNSVPGFCDTGNWSFLGVADTRDGDGLQIALQWATVNLLDPAPKFIIVAGDLDPTPRTDTIIQTYFGKTFYPVMGNHDKDPDREYVYQTFYQGKRLPNLVDSTLVEKEGAEAIAYSFAYDNVYFIALDQYYHDPFRSRGNVYDDQLDWLESQLMNNPYPFIFVIGHEPAFPLDSQRNYGNSMDRSPEDRDRFWATLAKYDVSAYLCGHTHSYLVQHIQNVWHIDLGQCHGTNYYNNLTQFIVYDDRVKVHAYYLDGKLHDQFTIRPRHITNPVQLASFSYQIIADKVTLFWQTTTEQDNYGFEIQKSDNNANYVPIGFVVGHGTTQQPQSYEFTDRETGTGIHYYRLKQVNFGGSFTYSEMLEVSFEPIDNFELAQNYPNPFYKETILSYKTSQPGFVTLNIYNATGQLTYTLVRTYRDAGIYHVNWDGTDNRGNRVPSGIYFYRLTADEKTVTRKMVLTW